MDLKVLLILSLHCIGQILPNNLQDLPTPTSPPKKTTNLNYLKPWTDHWRKNNQTLTPVYYNEIAHVIVYFDPYVSRASTWIFDFTSQVWSYMRDTYGDFGPHEDLYVVVHMGSPKLSHVAFSLNDVVTNGHDQRNVLDVGSNTEDAWLSSKSRHHEMDLILNHLAEFVDHSSNDLLGSPSHNVWKEPGYGDTAWIDIFTYDVYLQLNMTGSAEAYKAAKINKGDTYPKEYTFWFRDWFLPIYGNYGGNTVLNKYFELLQRNVPHQNSVYSYNLTMGDFVHFWSGAAGTDLRGLAEQAFGWDEAYEAELRKARDHFQDVNQHYNYSTKAAAENSTPVNVPIISIIASVPLMSIIVILLIAYLILYKRRIHNLKMEIRGLTNEEVKDFFEGDPHLNSEDEIQSHASVLSLPFVKDFEIPRDQIILARDKGILGSGNFGYVIHGYVRLTGKDELVAVAMKMIKPNVDVVYFKAFLSEVKIMAFLGHHKNIVRLVGTCTTNVKNREIYIALELCPLGNLLKYMKTNRNNFWINNYVEDAESEGPSGTSKFSSADLLKWSHEISNGMMYLTKKKVIHGDLAARNILLTENRSAKISDFGLSRQYLNYADYTKTSQTPVPWRWLAVECLKELKFSTASDVWAFGVTMWEIFSLGELPYGALSYDMLFVDKLIGGDRLLIPTYANQRLYRLMHDCWRKEPSERPTFEKINKIIHDIISSQSSNMEIVKIEPSDQDLYIVPVSTFDAETKINCENLA